MHPVLSLPGEDVPPPLMRPGSSLQGLIEATSNFCAVEAADWARMKGAFIVPTTIGAAKAVIPAMARAALLAKLSLSTIRFVMIASIRFRRSAPVTPDTHTSGDST